MASHTTRASRVVGGAIGALLVVAVLAAPGVRANDQDHESHAGSAPPALEGRVGVLLADHGEPPLYNEWTYESFREFFQHLIAMGIIPSGLTALETGTILYDADCPACAQPSESPRLIDAWLRPHDGPAVFVPASDSLAAHYVMAGGPGFREPDIYEHVGLAAWHEWQRMGGRSPNYDDKLAKKTAVIDRLRARFGHDIPVRVGYGIDPRIGGERQGIREALDALVNRDRVDSLVVVYHGVGFSDIMQTHHLRHQIAEHLEALGDGDMAIRYATPLGTTEHYVTAIVEKVQAELALLPADAPVAVHLSGHGLSTTMCGDYDCGADAYHRYAAQLFARVKPALEAAITRPGRTGIFHICGDSGEGDADPDNKVASPTEALDARVAEGGWTHVVDVPYEFDSNSRDTLIILRQGYGRPQPDWNHRYESHFAFEGLQVKIANANGGEYHKTDALEAVTLAALGHAGGNATAPAGDDRHHAARARDVGGHVRVASGGPAASPAGDAHAHDEPDATLASTTAAHPHPATGASGRFDTVGATAAGHGHGHGHESVADADADDHRHDAAQLATDAGGHAHRRGGAGSGIGIALVLAGGAALAVGATATQRSVGGRLAAGGLGAQLAGLGWDVITHAQAGAPVQLLENAGHWTAMIGLAATAVAAALLLRRPTVRAAHS